MAKAQRTLQHARDKSNCGMQCTGRRMLNKQRSLTMDSHVNPGLAIHHEETLQWLQLQEIPLSVHECTAFKNLSVCVGTDC